MSRKDYVNLHMDQKVDEIPFNRYPRPQLERDTTWLNLNGHWDCGVNVPFPLQSELSGFEGEVPDEYTYFTSFEYYPSWDKKSILHFGAVDQVCEVSIDGKIVGRHEGGYLPFSIDITEALGNNELHKIQVKVKDDLSFKYPYGKQCKNRGGMWYTPVSGIWQTVWIEEVPKSYIHGVRITPSDSGIRVEIDGDDNEYTVEVIAPDIYDSHNKYAGPAAAALSDDCEVIFSDSIYGNKTHIDIEDPKQWDTDNPWLYGLRIKGKTDVVATYFAIRQITVKKIRGFKRICLNDRPFFFHAVLDQGYYPEGIFLPNNESGYEQDILNMKELGFNALRKHIKIEPACFYEACDRLGMVVMQDMVNNSDYQFLRDTVFPTVGIKYKTDHIAHRNEEERAIFEQHMKDTVRYLYNFPCICYYTIFNEGWGQFDSDRMYEELKAIDDTRIVDSTSGWFKQFKSDVESKHVYFHPVAQLLHLRPIIVSEFGGYSYIEKGHIFNPAGNYGYKSFTDKRKLSEGIAAMYKRDIVSYISKGLCGSVLTQLSDVEDETNGCYTYDRKVCKLDKNMMIDISARIYAEFMKCTRQ